MTLVQEIDFGRCWDNYWDRMRLIHSLSRFGEDLNLKEKKRDQAQFNQNYAAAYAWVLGGTEPETQPSSIGDLLLERADEFLIRQMDKIKYGSGPIQGMICSALYKETTKIKN